MQTLPNAKFYLDKCERELSPDGEIIINAPNQLIAEGLRRCAFELAQWLEQENKQTAIIKWAGDVIGFPVFSFFASSFGADNPRIYKISQSSQSESRIIIPEDRDAELAEEAYSNKIKACWIIDQHTQEVLLANRVALDANHKPPREMLGKDISALWDENALQMLTEAVNNDRVIYDHTNIGFRWAMEEDRWFRKKHTFCVDYKLVNFLGRVARFEVVKEAVPI